MDASTESLEEFIDTRYKTLIEASTPLRTASCGSNDSMDSSLNIVPEEVQEVHDREGNPQHDLVMDNVNSDGNSQSVTMDDMEVSDLPSAQPSQPSQPSKPSVSLATPTPTALISLLRRTISEGGKRRRVDVSPIQASQNLTQDQATIAEGVFESLVRVMSDFLQDFTSKLTDQVETSLQRHKDGIDCRMNMQVKEIELLTEELNCTKDYTRILEGRLTRAEKAIEEMKEENLYQEARSMRDNLVFFNIPEETTGEEEDTKAVLREFLTEEMKVGEEDMEKIEFDRVHRSGPKLPDQHRIIVAKFNPGYGKDIVLKHGKNLDKAKRFGVNEQLPKELEQRKKQLRPQFKEARNNNKKPKWILDKLVIDNKIIKVEKDKVRDINTNTTKVAAAMTIKHAPFMEHNKESFRGPTTYQGHTAAISSQDDIIPTLHAIYADYKVARASHNTYAYRLKSAGGRITEHFQDDGDHGAGYHLLNLLKEKNITNRLVCVSTWSSGARLGRARFDQVRQSASLALETD